MTQETAIIPAEPEHARALARLHCQEIPTAFLSGLGERFLALLYDSLIRLDSGLCLIGVRGNQVQGVVAGAADASAFYRQFVRHRALFLPLSIFPHALRPSVARGIIENISYMRRPDDRATIKAELFSIVVTRAQRGSGLAPRLVASFARELAGRDVGTFRVAAAKTLIAANAFYEKLGLEPYDETEIHKGRQTRLYVGEVNELVGIDQATDSLQS